MVFEIWVWIILFFFSFGVTGLLFLFLRRVARRPWRLNKDENYAPKVSILVPTFNEAEVITFKLVNLSKIQYEKELIQVIVVDSNSEDGTKDIVQTFIQQHPEMNIEMLVENERKGKSKALNSALKLCDGDVVIVSDADCFWPSDILIKSMPFLADSNVGAISGPKVLLNPDASWVTKTEATYLRMMNKMKLGESKLGSTLFFEGGFGAFKRGVLESFDPYHTGSDDCGTVIAFVEKRLRAITVPEAIFYTSFPTTWRERIRLKMRRANQFLRVLSKYVTLLLKGRILGSTRMIVQGVFIYFLSPLIFVALAATTFILLLNTPQLAWFLLILLIPKISLYVLEAVQNYLVLLSSVFAVGLNKKFMLWGKPATRILVSEELLLRHKLI